MTIAGDADVEVLSIIVAANEKRFWLKIPHISLLVARHEAQAGPMAHLPAPESLVVAVGPAARGRMPSVPTAART